MPVDQFLSLSQYGGFSMLFIACTQGHEDVVEWLLKLGADVNQEANVSVILSLILLEWRNPLDKSLLLQQNQNSGTLFGTQC